MSSLKRNDSGYGSMHSVEFDDGPLPVVDERKNQQQMTHTMKLEFSNYAQLDVTRVGTKSGKRYEFDYWGVNYAWKRVVQRQQDSVVTRFHLVKAGSEQVLAHIVPVALSRSEARQEEAKGGWIAPCSMWIDDNSIIESQKDVSE
jgi:hypothetical protein